MYTFSKMKCSRRITDTCKKDIIVCSMAIRCPAIQSLYLVSSVLASIVCNKTFVYMWFLRVPGLFSCSLFGSISYSVKCPPCLSASDVVQYQLILNLLLSLSIGFPPRSYIRVLCLRSGDWVREKGAGFCCLVLNSEFFLKKGSFRCSQ